MRVGGDDRIVTLAGAVPNLKTRRDAEKHAWNSKNLRINNQLVVHAPGLNDEMIASSVSGAIQRHPFYGVFDWVEGDVNNGVLTYCRKWEGAA